MDEPAVPSVDGGLVRVRLDVAYDGTEFSGWARQPGRRTVQEVLETALATLLRAPAALTVAGRTDAGVHATGQVAHLDLPSTVDAHGDPSTVDAVADPSTVDVLEAEAVVSTVDAEELGRRLRRLLPGDVMVYGVRVVPRAFDARFGALRRHYAYRVADRPWPRAPLRRRDTLLWRRPLDEHRMAEAAAALLGERDFAAFCRRREGATTVRDLQRLDWRRDEDGVLVARVSADAFCHNMVRGLVGALLAVGDGRRPPTWPATLLAARERSGEVTVAPAHGLTLVGVDYPPDAELAARAARTRAVRPAT